jgi:hypothetical protein
VAEIKDFSATRSSRPSPAAGDFAVVAEQTREKAGELVEQAREAGGQIAAHGIEEAKPRLEDGKEQVVQTLSAAADALRRTGAEMTDQPGGVGRFAENAADRAERAAEFFGSRDLNEIVSEVESFARRQPAMFLGAAFGLGLLGARFLRTTGPATPPTSHFAYQPSAGQPSYADQFGAPQVERLPGANAYGQRPSGNA